MKGISLMLALAAFHAPAHHHAAPTCTARVFRQFSAAVWAPEKWERGAPPKNVIAAQRRRLACAGPGNRKAMKHRWRTDKAAFYAHRHAMRWFSTYRAFTYPDGSRWAVPYPIAWCESGGDYYVGPSGAYGLIPPFPQYMSPRRQDEVAYNLYVEQGDGPWAPYESGCAYR